MTSLQDAPHVRTVPLTPAEHRVAVLVCEGLTNPGVAQELYLSVNTISSHLRSIYAKLQVHSRVTLVLALQAASRADEPGPSTDRRPGVGRLGSGVHGLARRA